MNCEDGPERVAADRAGSVLGGYGGAGTGRLRDNRAFRLFWAAEAISNTGTGVGAVALPLVAVVALGAGPVAIGLLEAAIWAPWLAIGLVAGAVVDRVKPRTLMISCDVVAASVFALVPMASLLGLLTMHLLVAAALCAGGVNVLSQAARQIYPPLVAEDDQLEAANSSLEASESVTELAGAPLAGLATHLFGAVAGVSLNAASFMISAALLWASPAPTAARRPSFAASSAQPGETTATACSGDGPTGARQEHLNGDRHRNTGSHRPLGGHSRRLLVLLAGLHADVVAGLRYVLADQWLRGSATAAAAANFAITGVGALQVLLLLRDVGIAPGWYGPLLFAEGAGGLLGAAFGTRLAARIGTCRALVVLAIAGPLAGVLITFTAPGWSLAFFIVGGMLSAAATVGGNVVWAVFRQRYIPSALLGRGSAAIRVIAYAAAPLGALVAGALATSIGVRAAIAVLFGCVLVRGMLFMRRPWRTARDLPAPATSPVGV